MTPKILTRSVADQSRQLADVAARLAHSVVHGNAGQSIELTAQALALSQRILRRLKRTTTTTDQFTRGSVSPAVHHGETSPTLQE